MDSIDTQLRDAVKVIKNAILQRQYKAAIVVNKEQLSLYFGIGKYVSENSRSGYWGTGAIERISEQLQKELPGFRGFGAASIKNMRQFYEEWEPYFVSADLNDVNLPILQNRYPTVSDFEGFADIGFTHHMIILRHAKQIEDRLFYIRQTNIHQWNKYQLTDMLKADLYHHQSNLPNNFAKAISDPRTTRKALDMFKDEYLLDFINVEEIGERDKADIDERVVEQAIIHNVKNFIMTFGRDFTFVVNQYHLEKYAHDFYPDLLFYKSRSHLRTQV